MKTCNYCGRENDDTLTACRECGTQFSSAELEPPARPLSRRARIMLWTLAALMLVVVLLAMPALLVAVPVFAIFFLPVYLPFLLSFAIRAHEWRGLRWALRVGSVLALLIALGGISSRPNYGEDVAGNFAGAGHNLAWVWGGGVACAVAAMVIGLVSRVFITPRPHTSPEEAHAHD